MKLPRPLAQKPGALTFFRIHVIYDTNSLAIGDSTRTIEGSQLLRFTVRLLVLLVVLASITPAHADVPVFRYVAAKATEMPTVTSTDQGGLPPGMSNGSPGVPGEPGMSRPNSGLLEVSALPGWSWQIPWTAKPSLTLTEIYANGRETLVEMTVTLGRRGCARATVGFFAATGIVQFSTFRNDTTGPCGTPTQGDWSAAAGQPYPSTVKPVRTSALPEGKGNAATELTFKPVY